jgi:DNA invertase Pin-like site-specific DNA recombinase
VKQQVCNAALYCRLSRDDGAEFESSSIATQRQMLRQYANEQGFHVVGEYIDDGWSGVNFDRPEFERMIEDIEDGRINLVITKDLSRLGRNYILTGQYTEMYFPSKGVRYIALNDGIDSNKGESEIAAFKNILNEMTARDTSRKVKSAIRTKFLSGDFIAPSIPLGYKRDPERKNKLIPNGDTKWVVEKIFQMAAHGDGGAKIQRALRAEKIPIPSWWRCQMNGQRNEFFENSAESEMYKWNIPTIKRLLENEAYIGNLIHNKRGSVSFKNKKQVDRPPEEWLRVDGAHEPIISRELWDTAQAHINSRKRSTRAGENLIFAGLLRCADCGWTLACAHQRENGRRYYRCSRYAVLGAEECTAHNTSYNLLYGVVLGRLQYWLREVRDNKDKMLNRLLQTGDKQREAEQRHIGKELQKSEKRQAELNNLFAKMYEDRAAGRLDEDNYTMLSGRYRAEQAVVSERAEVCKAKLSQSEQHKQGAVEWLRLIEKYVEFNELSAPLLNELIDKILVHQAHKDENGNTVREIEIYYRFVGKIE